MIVVDLVVYKVIVGDVVTVCLLLSVIVAVVLICAFANSCINVDDYAVDVNHFVMFGFVVIDVNHVDYVDLLLM